MNSSVLNGEILDTLLTSCSLFCQKEIASVRSLFPKDVKRCVDNPDIPNHIYYEGYFHGKEETSKIESVNPRNGHEIPKSSAPLELRALLCCMKEKNKKWFENLAQLLLDWKTELQSKSQSTSLVDLVLSFISQGKIFSDLAVQFNYGDSIAGEDLGWHIDAPTFLHMAISISGKRALHIRTSTQEEEEDKKEMEKKKEKEKEITQILWQKPRDVYISPPSYFVHAVEYPKCAWEDKIIAVQARTLLNAEEFIAFDKEIKKDLKQWKSLELILVKAIDFPWEQPSWLEFDTRRKQMELAQAKEKENKEKEKENQRATEKLLKVAMEKAKKIKNEKKKKEMRKDSCVKNTKKKGKERKERKG